MMATTDPKAFRRALGQFATGVCVTTTRVDDEPLGMTMTSFNSLSLDPALVLFAIDKRSMALPKWEQAKGYAIHVLAHDQEELSNRFAGRGTDKWADLKAEAGPHGEPLLGGVAARFDCDAFQRHDVGDHILFIAKVTAFSADFDQQPLLFVGGRYGAVA